MSQLPGRKVLTLYCDVHLKKNIVLTKIDIRKMKKRKIFEAKKVFVGILVTTLLTSSAVFVPLNLILGKNEQTILC